MSVEWKEIDRVGGVSTDELRAVLKDAENHPGGYDRIMVRLYKDGTGEIRTSMGFCAAIDFERFPPPS